MTEKNTHIAGNIEGLTKAIGYTFNDEGLLVAALTHRSMADRTSNNAHGSNNERLEFLGDAVLSLVTASYLYGKNSGMNEGELSRLRAKFVCKAKLGDSARSISLGNHIMSDKAMRAAGCNNSDSVLADALEAIIGAVFLDGGLEKARDVIFRIMGFPSSDLKESSVDAKTKLQEVVQASTRLAPEYVLLSRSGPAHSPTFIMGVKINDDIVATAKGVSKKAAAQDAASQALQKLLSSEEPAA